MQQDKRRRGQQAARQQAARQQAASMRLRAEAAGLKLVVLLGSLVETQAPTRESTHPRCETLVLLGLPVETQAPSVGHLVEFTVTKGLKLDVLHGAPLVYRAPSRASALNGRAATRKTMHPLPMDQCGQVSGRSRTRNSVKTPRSSPLSRRRL